MSQMILLQSSWQHLYHLWCLAGGFCRTELAQGVAMRVRDFISPLAHKNLAAYWQLESTFYKSLNGITTLLHCPHFNNSIYIIITCHEGLHICSTTTNCFLFWQAWLLIFFCAILPPHPAFFPSISNTMSFSGDHTILLTLNFQNVTNLMSWCRGSYLFFHDIHFICLDFNIYYFFQLCVNCGTAIYVYILYTQQYMYI